jgi:hypothetical protein
MTPGELAKGMMLADLYRTGPALAAAVGAVVAILAAAAIGDVIGSWRRRRARR